MTTIAPKPDWAPAIWRDNQGKIYVQFGQDVLRFDYTADALGKILKLLPAVEAQPGFVSGGQNIADQTLAKKTSNKPSISRKLDRQKILKAASAERRAKFRELFQKSGIKEKETK